MIKEYAYCITCVAEWEDGQSKIFNAKTTLPVEYMEDVEFAFRLETTALETADSIGIKNAAISILNIMNLTKLKPVMEE